MDEELQEAIRSASAVRFLCTGNMVRSAFAELYARHLGCRIPVDSAGTLFQNAGLYPETETALLERGVDPGLLGAFRSRRLDRVPPDDQPARIVFGMTSEHLEAYRACFGGPDRPFLLTRLAGGAEPVADPVLDGAPFGDAFATVERCVRALIAALG